jgi:hypothetical protein
MFKKLIINFKFKPSLFMFDSLSNYNLYFFLNLKKNKNYVIRFFKKNFLFFDVLKRRSVNSNYIYNNHTPVYNTNKNTIKKFKKIFKSFFGKKFGNNIYYYVIPFFENFIKKKVIIKALNLNMFKKKKFKKKFLLLKLLKIFKKNKDLVIARSSKFNIAELLQIILHTFYKKDTYLLMN